MTDKKPTILIVDDDEDDCIFLKESLETVEPNYCIQYILSAEEALHFLKQTEVLPALIILDINMPKINGIELLRMIKNVYDVPMMLHTTNCTDDIISEGRRLGAIDCIKKGSTLAENLQFAKKVFDLLKSKRE